MRRKDKARGKHAFKLKPPPGPKLCRQGYTDHGAKTFVHHRWTRLLLGFFRLLCTIGRGTTRRCACRSPLSDDEKAPEELFNSTFVRG
jgi:hypothetical protein